MVLKCFKVPSQKGFTRDKEKGAAEKFKVFKEYRNTEH
jgi:hypothetical protein